MAGVSTPSKCLHGNGLFHPDPRHRGRQSFCAKLDGRQAGKRHSQAKWLNQAANADSFKGPANSERVRPWRARHPGSWKRSGKPRCPSPEAPSTQGDLKKPVHQTLKPEPSPVALQDPCPPPLQNPSLPYPPVFGGLVALHLGAALQQDILPYLDLAKAVRPGHEAKRVNVDFPQWMLARLDLEADRLGVPRQSLIKVWIAERLALTRRIKPARQ